MMMANKVRRKDNDAISYQSVGLSSSPGPSCCPPHAEKGKKREDSKVREKFVEKRKCVGREKRQDPRSYQRGKGKKT